MKKTVYIEIGWVLLALTLPMVQTSILMNWNNGLVFNIVTLALAVTTIQSVYRATEIAFISGSIMDALSATPFGIHIVTLLLFIGLLHIVIRYIFHSSVLYTVGIAAAIVTIIITTLYITTGSLLLQYEQWQWWNIEWMKSILWHGILQGFSAALLLSIIRFFRAMNKQHYGV